LHHRGENMKKFKLFQSRVIAIIISFLFIQVSGANINLVGQSEINDTNRISQTAAAPTVNTNGASSIAATTVTLNAYVNANNESTTVSFEYSTSGDFSGEVPATTIAATPSPVTGSSQTAISANVTGLTPGTRYFFRAVGTNGSGTVEGSIMDFFTLPPSTVTTGIASPVTTTTATLNGTVNANGNSTTVTFEYGTTDSYGTTVTADQSPVTGTTDTAVSKALTGLTPNTTYHFRVVGVNGLGTTDGLDQTFFTSTPTAPTATTDYATFSSTSNEATLNGIINANNADSTVTFEYGQTTAYGNTVTADQSPVLGAADTAVSKHLTGLSTNTTYHYRVVATNSQGTTYGADMTFYNTAAPYARTDAAAAVAQTTATVYGTVNPKTFDGGTSTYTTVVTFEYGTTASYGSTVTASESPIGGEVNIIVSFPLTGLAPNTTYHYRVVATNTDGTGTGADMTFTTSSLPVVSTNSAAPVGVSTATLNGTVNANDDSTTVSFEYGTSTSYGSIVTADQSPVTGTTDTAVSRAITGLALGTTYHYRAVATNGSGTVNGADMTFTTGVTPPTVSTDAATSVNTTSAVLNGTVNANGLSTSVSFQWGFTTAYGLSNPASPGFVTGTSNTAVSFNPTTILPNTTYHYRVVAQNAGGTIYGADMSFTTLAVPTVVTNAASPVTTTSATLNGTAIAHNQSSVVTFEYGTTTAYGTTVTADQSPVTGSTTTTVSKAITGLTPSTTYHYRVVGTNASGTSYGADMTFSTAVGPPVATTGTASPLMLGAVVNGTVNAQNNTTTVTFEYGTTVAYGSSIAAVPSPVTGSANTDVTATISGLTFNTTYHYRVVATNSNGTTNGLDMTFKTSLNPTATTGTAVNILASTATVNGIGNANSSAWSAGFQYGTTVAYGSTASGTPSSVSGSDDTPFSATLTGLTPGTTYHYRAMLYSGMSYYGSDQTFTTLSGPTVTTNAATTVSATGATLNGTINAQNDSTAVNFEYGLDTSYGQTINANPYTVTGNTNTAVSLVLTNLIPNRTYHFRVVGSNTSGTVYGADLTLSTPAIAPTVSTNAATGVGATGATLVGTVNANNDSTTVTFEYGTSTAYGTTVTADQSPLTGNNSTLVTKGITGLTANTTYHYRVVGQNGSGVSNGSDMTFTTGTNTPTATTNAATGISLSAATLNGAVNANGTSTTVTFEFGTSTAYGKTYTAVQSPVTGTTDTAVNSAISGLIGSTTYHYRVVAQNAYGTTYGTDMTFTTAGSAPITTTGAASTVGATTATLNGTVNANNDSTTVTFEYGTTIAYGSTATAAQSPVTGGTNTPVTGDITGLSPTSLYHYRVVAQNAFGTTYGTDMTFTTSTVSIPIVSTKAISHITVSTADSGGTVTDAGLGTVTARGVCWSTSPNPTITDDLTSDGNGLGSFTSSITGLMPETLYYIRAYATNSAGTGYGPQRSFTTDTQVFDVTITNPIDDAVVSGTVVISASVSNAPDRSASKGSTAKAEFYIDDVQIGIDTSEPYTYDWDTSTVAEGQHTIKVIATNDTGNTSQDSITVTVVTSSGSLLLNRTHLNFGAVPNGNGGSRSSYDVTYDQMLMVDTADSVSWSVKSNASWLTVSPATGTGAGWVTVSVDPTGLSTGSYSAVLSAAGTNVQTETATVDVALMVYDSGATSVPFGTFDSPANGATVMSSIPITGWVLDDIAVSGVKIYRSSGNGMAYIGNAVLVDGARPDVEMMYPTYPFDYQAGWGYMLLTNGLPSDGTYTLYAIATDMEGNEVTLGSKTITVDNTNAVNPFGTIDTPAQGSETSGASYVNFGWALTPQPNTIPTDGSTIKVWVDGVPLSGHPVYNQFRQDIADMFPGYNNTNGAVGYMIIDTTTYQNGLHTISWSVKDNAGNIDGIGSRYFSILNNGSSPRIHSIPVLTPYKTIIHHSAVQYMGAVTARKGYETDGNILVVPSDENNASSLIIDELEPVLVRLETNLTDARGFLVKEGELYPLPIGSTFDEQTGSFSWLPGPGFVGTYRFIFVFKTDDGQYNKKTLFIHVVRTFYDMKQQGSSRIEQEN
jgi:phosphodiesterase/alkaline phosphatase D-like protein